MRSGKLPRAVTIWLIQVSNLRSRIVRILCFFSGVLLLCGASAGQSPVDDSSNVGLPTTGAFNGSNVDAVQLQNRGLSNQVPIAAIKGRGLSLQDQYV